MHSLRFPISTLPTNTQLCSAGVLNFITAQNKVIGQDADGKGEHIPDNGHSLKDCSNSLYEIRSKDKSY